MKNFIFIFILYLCSSFNTFGQGNFFVSFSNVCNKPIYLKCWDGTKIIFDVKFESGEVKVFEFPSYKWFYFERRDEKDSQVSADYVEHIKAANLQEKEENAFYKVIRKEKGFLSYLLYTNENHHFEMTN